MKRLGGTLVAFIVGFAAFYPFLAVAQCNGDCIVTTYTLWGLPLSVPVGTALGVGVGLLLAAVVHRALTRGGEDS